MIVARLQRRLLPAAQMPGRSSWHFSFYQRLRVPDESRVKEEQRFPEACVGATIETSSL
jgi:hypothetical protein